MEEVEDMVPFHTQRDTLLHNILGRWDPQKKVSRKLKYSMVLLEDVAKCGGAPVKHTNWAIVPYVGEAELAAGPELRSPKGVATVGASTAASTFG